MKGFVIDYYHKMLNSSSSSFKFKGCTADSVLVLNMSYNGFLTKMNESSMLHEAQLNENSSLRWQSCQLGLSAWFKSSSRFGMVDFVEPMAFSGNAIAESSPPTYPMFFVLAFTTHVWIFLCLLLLLFVCIKLLDKRFVPPVVARDEQTHHSSIIRKFVQFVCNSQRLYRIQQAVQSVRKFSGFLFFNTCLRSFKLINMKLTMCIDMGVFLLLVGRMVGMASKPYEGEMHSTRQWLLNFIITLTGLFLFLIYEATMTYVWEPIHKKHPDDKWSERCLNSCLSFAESRS